MLGILFKILRRRGTGDPAEEEGTQRGRDYQINARVSSRSLFMFLSTVLFMFLSIVVQSRHQPSRTS